MHPPIGSMLRWLWSMRLGNGGRAAPVGGRATVLPSPLPLVLILYPEKGEITGT